MREASCFFYPMRKQGHIANKIPLPTSKRGLFMVKDFSISPLLNILATNITTSMKKGRAKPILASEAAIYISCPLLQSTGGRSILFD
jgi:hypothetical protein